MCGIAGTYNFNGAPADAALLSAMASSLRHRGPDAQTFHVDGAVGLAHSRLSIIDLAGGAQPMSNETGSVWIVFNGEIFNFVELAEDLKKEGVRLRTRSDTEVLLKLYERYGEDCVRYLNGQWAFAIWDRNARKLFLSRDRVGVRPIFYTRTANAFLFGSEAKAIFQCSEVSRELDPAALDEICTFWSTVAPRTMFRAIRELPAGHSMVVQGQEVRVYRHWDLALEPDSDSGQKEEAYAEQLWDLLRDATRIRLRADVPVATYLSGGLDSSVTTALVKDLTKSYLRSFSVTFEDSEFDESSYQREMVRHLGTDHQEVRCTKDDIARIFPDVIWHCEKPIVRTAPAPLFMLSQLVRDNGFKVVLTGEGSDEMLGGYDIFKEAKVRAFWARRLDSKFRAGLLSRLYPYMPNLQSQSDSYRRAFFRVSEEDIHDPFFSHLPRWALTSKVKVFFSDEVAAEAGTDGALNALRRSLPESFDELPLFCRAQYLEAMYLMPGYILSSQGDRVAMAHSVEVRLPFLDHRVVSFAARLPLRLKMKVLNEKYLLKKCAGQLLPKSITSRSKQPYRAPDGVSFFTSGPRDYVREMLSPDRIRRTGLFKAEAVDMLTKKFVSGRAIGVKDNMAMVAILSTQILHDQFVENFRVVSGTDNANRTATAAVCD